MALASTGITAKVARHAISDLICTATELPTAAEVIGACRDSWYSDTLKDIRCERCGSAAVVADAGWALCFDCDHVWSIA